MKYILMILTLTFTLIATSPIKAQTRASMVVVVSKSSSITALSSTEVANIFLARTNRFPNGEKSIPVEMEKGLSKTHFYERISGKSPRQLLSYWTTLVFTGKGRPPKGYSDFDELKQKFVHDNNVITYIDASQVTEQMRVVYTFP